MGGKRGQGGTSVGTSRTHAEIAGTTVFAKGQEVLHGALDDAQTMILQAQVADDLLVQQAHGIAGGRVTETRMEFFGDGGAARDATALKDPDFQPTARQVAGTGQAVVAGADDGDVVFQSR